MASSRWVINQVAPDARIPSLLHPLIADYIGGLQGALPGLIEGCYLHGSIALDAFHPAFSDIDFIAFLGRSLTGDEVERLGALHEEMRARYPGWKLAGSYLQWGDLGRLEEDAAPAPYAHDGLFHPRGSHDINPVTWWLLKHRGITLLGPPPESLPYSINWALVREKMHENLNQYWARYTRSPVRLLHLLTDDGIQWAVLGVLRQFYSFREHDITSKRDAGRYALEHLPTHWHRLIQEAINLRDQAAGSLYGNRLSRALDARRFMRDTIRRCNAELASHAP